VVTLAFVDQVADGIREVAVRRMVEKICVGSCLESSLVIFEFFMAVPFNVAVAVECYAFPIYQTNILAPSSGSRDV
jgi:hypothetical protein